MHQHSWQDFRGIVSILLRFKFFQGTACILNLSVAQFRDAMQVLPIRIEASFLLFTLNEQLSRTALVVQPLILPPDAAIGNLSGIRITSLCHPCTENHKTLEFLSILI